MTPAVFYSSCVDWPEDADADGGLRDMVDRARQILRRTFVKHVDPTELQMLEARCGYAPRPGTGLQMAGDPYVTYHRSTLHGVRVYYFRWSAIEFVFMSPDFMEGVWPSR